MKKISVLLLLMVSFMACSKEKGSDIPAGDPAPGVFICNEGNYMDGNGSLSFYNPATKKVQNQIFYNRNGFPLGDVVQSMTIIGRTGFVVANNSGKVYAIDIDDYSYIGAITGLTSPRYVEPVSQHKIYISDLYSTSVTVADPTTFAVTGYIPVTPGTEQMTKAAEQPFVYICGWSYNDQVYKIDTRINETVDSITVTKQPNSIVTDKNGKLWVLSDGGYEGSPYGQEMAALTRIDPVTFTIEATFRFPDMALSPAKLCIDGAKEKLYFINGGFGTQDMAQTGICRMKITDTALPTAPLIPQGSRTFYGLGVDPVSGDIYVSDAIDYTQRGVVYRYDANGTQIDQFKTDITPGYFCFKTE